MTLEEARQLKPGDYVSAVFVIMESNRDRIIDEDGELKLAAVDENGHICTRRRNYLAPEYVQKAEKPRRKFLAGDVVYAFCGYWGVSHDENENGIVEMGNSNQIRSAFSSELILVCAVEDRADKKGGEA